MPRVLIFSISYDPYWGGAEIAIREITRCLPDVHFDIVTLRFRNSDKSYEEFGNINLYRVRGGKYLYPFIASIKGLILHRKNPYNVVWSMMANYAGFAGLFFSYIAKKPESLLTLQEGDPFEYILKRVRFILPVFKKIFERADNIQAISHYLAEFGIKMGFKGKPYVIPNGVDIERFGNRAPWPRKRKEKILITTSRLVEKNAIDNIIFAIKVLPPSIKLFILGTGPLEKELKKLVAELNLKDRVGFFGFVRHEEMSWYFNKADIFVRPSRSEGLGNSFLEAMAIGIPVIGTPVGGIPDFLHDKKTGFFVRVDDPVDIAKKVSYILDKKNVDKVGRIIENARTLVEEEYSWGKIANDMKRFFIK